MSKPQLHLVKGSDAELLDSYSQTVAGVFGRAARAVVHIKVKGWTGRGRRRVLEDGSGSGFVISSDGYVVTNDHVVGGAKEVKVTFSDGLEVNAEVKGTDPSTDIALIKIYE